MIRYMADCFPYTPDRKKQQIWIEGTCYTSRDFSSDSFPLPEKYRETFRELRDFLREWFNDSPCLSVQTSGSTGIPQHLSVPKEQMMQSARMTCSFLNLHPGDTALLCMPLKYIGAKMMVVRALIAGLNLIVRPASGHPLSEMAMPIDFAAMVPLQVYNSLQVPGEKGQLEKIKILIIGGSAIDLSLEEKLSCLPNRIYSTYGMTETLSHIALRQLNGPERDLAYTPFPSVKITTDEEGCIQIDAPSISGNVIQTHDIGEILPDNRFLVKGRKDNVINSGGIKIQIETVERIVAGLLSSPFAITSVPDPKLGEQLVLLTSNKEEVHQLEKEIKNALPAYYYPRQIIQVESIPSAGNGKINRYECKEIALRKCGYKL